MHGPSTRDRLGWESNRWSTRFRASRATDGRPCCTRSVGCTRRQTGLRGPCEHWPVQTVCRKTGALVQQCGPRQRASNQMRLREYGGDVQKTATEPAILNGDAAGGNKELPKNLPLSPFPLYSLSLSPSLSPSLFLSRSYFPAPTAAVLTSSTSLQAARPTESHRHRHRQTDRQTGRQTDRHTDTQTDRHTDTQTDTKTDR